MTFKYRRFNYPETIWVDGVQRTCYPFVDETLGYSEPHWKLPNGQWSGGGRFFVGRISRSLVFHNLHLNGPAGVRHDSAAYYGARNLSPVAPFPSIQADAPSRILITQGFGATAWKRAAPGNPVAGIANFVGELREGLPRLPGLLLSRLQRFRNLGDEYLNVVFGWLPFVREVQKMYELHRTLDRRLAQIYRDNGRGIHRKLVLKDNTSTAVSFASGSSPFATWEGIPPSPWAVNGMGSRELVTTTFEKIWFAGKFRYYIPDVGSSEWTARATRALYGAYPTPDVLYELLPWSWLIGWFSNVGDMLSNAFGARAVDNLTADYAFIMREHGSYTVANMKATWGPNAYGSPGGSVHLSREISRDHIKTRAVASPYGFGVTYDGLSAYQKSVLAALGVSRARF